MGKYLTIRNYAGRLFTQRIIPFLSHRYLLAALVAISIFLAIPSLWTGLVIDDYYHKAIIQEVPAFSGLSPWHIFIFLDGNPIRTSLLREKGVVPWWTMEKVKLSFWRPLSVLTHWLDYKLWPNSHTMMHIHSLLWLALSVIMIFMLYRRFISVPWVAGLAALLYTIDDAHAIPVAWLANRNILIALPFGVAAIIFHDQWRRKKDHRMALPALLCLGIGLLAKESAIAACAYLFAYAFCIDEGGWRTKIFSLTPYAFLIVVWKVLYQMGGFGVWGVDYYTDPVTSPLRFLKNLPVRAASLLISQWALSEPFSLSKIVLPPWAIVFLIIVTIALVSFLHRDRVARFWFLGMMLTLIPASTSWPSERILFFIGLGAMGLIAQFIHTAGTFLSSKAPFYRRAAAGILCSLLILIHLILAPIMFPLKIWFFSAWGEGLTQSIEKAPIDAAISNKTVLLVNAMVFYPAFLPVFRTLKEQPIPDHFYCLAFNQETHAAIHIFRPDDQSLMVRSEDAFSWQFFRDADHPLPAGSRIKLDGMKVDVTKLTGEGWPLEVIYRFPVPLEDPSLVWLQLKDTILIPFTPPAVGESVVLNTLDPH